MSDLREEILGVGRKIADGSLSDGEGRKALDELAKSNHLSSRQLKKTVLREASKMRMEVNVKQRKLDELMQTESDIERLKLLEESLKDDSRSPAVTVRYFKDGFPAAWSDAAQRIYKHVDSYGNYQLAYLEWGWALVLKQWKDEVGDSLTADHQDALNTFTLHKDHGFPFFFVSPGICEAAWRSDLKFAVDWKTMHLPYEAFTLVLPKTNPLGCEAIIVYRRVRDGDVRLTMSVLGKKPLGEEIVPEWPFETKGDTESEITRWVFNTIYAMSARPEYVEGGERVGTKKGTSSEIWTPNVIGRKYAVKSHSPSAQSSGSRRLHWRRGHFRRQPFGIGRSQLRTIWIEPMMIGGSNV